MNVSHADKCPDCKRTRGVVESRKPKSPRFCWVRNGAVCMRTQIAYERAITSPARNVVERARVVIAQPYFVDMPIGIRAAVLELARAVVEFDTVEPPIPEETAAE